MGVLPLHVILHLRYFLENEGERPLYFTIGVNSGIIRTTQVLDREETAWHNITVMAAEVGKFTATADQIKLSVFLHIHPSASIHEYFQLPIYTVCVLKVCSGGQST